MPMKRLTGGRLPTRRAHAARHEREHARVDAHGHLRRVAGAANMLSTSPTRCGSGSIRWKQWPSRPRLVRDVVHRVGDEIHRHDVDAPALDAERRHPLRQHLAQLLDQREQVVRAVDLVDLAGLRMRRPPCPAGRCATGPCVSLRTSAFGIVLGAEVRIVQALGLVEHVLAEHARVQAGGGDRTGVVEAAGLDRGGQFQRVPRAVDVGDLLRFRVGGEVVDRGEVEEMLRPCRSAP